MKVTTHASTKNCDNSTVSAHNLGQIGEKRDSATEACSQHVVRSRQEGDERRPPRWAVPEQDAEASSDGEAESHGVARKATSDDCPDGQCRSRMRRQEAMAKLSYKMA